MRAIDACGGSFIHIFATHNTQTASTHNQCPKSRTRCTQHSPPQRPCASIAIDRYRYGGFMSRAQAVQTESSECVSGCVCYSSRRRAVTGHEGPAVCVIAYADERCVCVFKAPRYDTWTDTQRNQVDLPSGLFCLACPRDCKQEAAPLYSERVCGASTCVHSCTVSLAVS